MDDSARAQVEHAGDSGRDFIVFHNAGTKSFHIHAQRVCLADCVGNLDFAAGGQPGSHHILGYPARGIRAGAVHFGRVFAAEAAAAVPAHAAVGIHDNLAAGQPGIAQRSANHEAPGGVSVDFNIFINKFRRENRFNHMFNQIRADLFVADNLASQLIGMLGADEHGINASGFAVMVFHCHLAFAVWVHPFERAVLAHFRHAAAELVREINRKGQQLFGFVAGIPKHHALVTRAAGIDVFLAVFHRQGFPVLVHTARDIGGLRGNRNHHGAGGAVEAFFAAVVTDAVNHIAHQFFDIHVGVRGHLAGHQHKTGFGDGFNCHARGGISPQSFVKHGVADLVANFVRVAFGHGLGCKQIFG